MGDAIKLKNHGRGRGRCRCPPPPNQYPWLVFFHGKSMRNQTFYSLCEPNNRSVRSIHELRKKQVWLSCHGWLLLSDDKSDQFYLWNPVTMDSISLPLFELQPKQQIKDILLTSPPENPESTLLLFVRGPQNIILFCCIKDRTWIKRGYCKEIKAIGETCYDWDHFCHPVLCNNRIYAASYCKSNMVEIEIVKPTSLVISPLHCRLPPPELLGIRMNTYLVESCGDLFMISLARGGVRMIEVIAIFVMKLDFSTMIWNEVVSCPDRAFFLSNGTAISCRCTADSNHLFGGKIYFTLHGKDERLYSYDIEDKNVLMSLPCPDIPTPWKTPTWILPDAPNDHYNPNGEEEYQDQGGKVDTQLVRDGGRGDIIVDANWNFLDHLPIEILNKIAACLSLFDYMSFRAVCRSCRSVATAKQWRTVFTSMELESHNSSPWLIYPGKVKGVWYLVDPKLGAQYKCFITVPQILEDAIICYSKNGWLLMTKKGNLTLYNPLTKSDIRLPNLTQNQSLFFSSLPNSPDCVVFGIDVNFQTIYLTRPGMERWILLDLIKEEENAYFFFTNNYPVFLDGSFYFLCDSGFLGVVTLRLEEYYATFRVHKMKIPCASFEQNFLVEYGGELLSVCVGKAGKWLQVFKLKQSAMVWEEVKNLGKNSLYLCNLSSLATEAKTPEMENKIYFPRFDGESIIFYDMETRKFHSSESNDSLMNFYGSKEQLSCCWFEPRWNSAKLKHDLLLSDMDDLFS